MVQDQICAQAAASEGNGVGIVARAFAEGEVAQRDIPVFLAAAVG